MKRDSPTRFKRGENINYKQAYQFYDKNDRLEDSTAKPNQA